MIPILYEKTETEFIFNGLGRLYDCITFTITEERNGIFECEFKYPVDGVNFNQVQVGQIVAASINDSGKIQPFDIVSASKPINGVVTFYGTHISYRLNKVTASGSNINSLTAALTMLGTGTPTNPFTFEANFEASGYMSAADGTPRTVRSMLGGVEGSILDTYGGEFEFDSWTVRLLKSRGSFRLNPIRYGLNLVDYNEELDASESFSGVVPFWKNDVALVKGAVVDSGETTLSGRTEIIPLDCSDKFENEPTAAQLESYAQTYLSSSRPYLPKQTINVDFVNLADTLEYKDIAPLLDYKLCDTVPVSFPMYGTEAEFKIVRTVYDVLAERYTEMELGQLSTTLSEALGINQGGATSGSSGVHIIETGTNGIWTYRKWSDGTAECWGILEQSFTPAMNWGSTKYADLPRQYFPTSFFVSVPSLVATASKNSGYGIPIVAISELTSASFAGFIDELGNQQLTYTLKVSFHAIGKWK